MPTLIKQRKRTQASTSAGGPDNGAGDAGAAAHRLTLGQDLAPPRQPDYQLRPLLPPQGDGDAQAQRLREQQHVVEAMQGMLMDDLMAGVPPGGPLQVGPWPPPLLQQQAPPQPLPPQDPLLSIARMERCPRCHLRTWSFNQDPVTGALRTNALTIPGQVYNGRCLLCFPLPNGLPGTSAVVSVISNDDNGSVYSGRPRAADGPGPVDRAANTRVEAAAAAAAAAAASSAAKPSDSVRVDSPDDLSRKVRPGLIDIAEEQVPNEPSEQQPEQQPEEQPENGLNSSQEGMKATDASSKGDSASGAAATAVGVSESSGTATNEPTCDGALSAGFKGGRGSRKRRKDDEAAEDAESSRGIKRSNLRSRYPQRPRPSTASTGTGTIAISGTGERRQSPKRRQKTKAPTPEDNIRAALSELTGESIKAGSQLRCLKRIFSFFRTAGSPEKEEVIVSRFVKLRGVEAILSLMKSGSCEVVRYCGEVLLYVCYYDVDITMQLRVHDVMKDALIAYPNNPTLVQVVVGVLQQCVDNDFAIDRDIIAGGCLDQAVLAATSHRSMPKIQLNFCLFLQDLTSELRHRSDMEHLLRHQPLDCLMQAIKKNFKDDAIVLAGLASITNIFQEEVDPRYNRQAFQGLKNTLLKIMKSSRSASVVAQSLALLCSVSRESGGVNKLIVESGFIARVKTLMKAFCECAEVQRNGNLLLEKVSLTTP